MANVVREKYIGTKQIMDMLSISRNTALQILHSKDFAGKVFKRGRLLRVKQSDFMEFCKRYGG